MNIMARIAAQQKIHSESRGLELSGEAGLSAAKFDAGFFSRLKKWGKIKREKIKHRMMLEFEKKAS
jgi:hypothetical protein